MGHMDHLRHVLHQTTRTLHSTRHTTILIYDQSTTVHIVRRPKLPVYQKGPHVGMMGTRLSITRPIPTQCTTTLLLCIKM